MKSLDVFGILKFKTGSNHLILQHNNGSSLFNLYKTFPSLSWLYSGNQITEIKGLESLSNLQDLFLYDIQITEIKNLEALANLQRLELYGNQIPKYLVKQFGHDLEKYIDYCRNPHIWL